MYYNNDLNTKRIEEYKTLDPKTEEAKELMTALIIDGRLVASGVYFTHRLHRFGKTLDEAKSIADEQFLKAMPKYDPLHLNNKGKTTSFFSYISLTAKNAIYWASIAEIGRRTTKEQGGHAKHSYIFIPIHELENTIGYEEDNTPSERFDFRDKYSHLFTKKNHIKMFSLLCDYVEMPGADTRRHKCSAYMTNNMHLLCAAKGGSLTSKTTCHVYFKEILNIIKEDEGLDTSPPGRCKALKCIETGEVYKSAGDVKEELGIKDAGYGARTGGATEKTGNLHWEFV